MDKDRKIADKAIDLYLEILNKQILPFPHNGLFHKVTQKEIEDYWYPIISNIEQILQITLEKDLKLRYANCIFALPGRAEIIKEIKGGDR